MIVTNHLKRHSIVTPQCSRVSRTMRRDQARPCTQVGILPLNLEPWRKISFEALREEGPLSLLPKLALLRSYELRWALSRSRAKASLFASLSSRTAGVTHYHSADSVHRRWLQNRASFELSCSAKPWPSRKRRRNLPCFALRATQGAQFCSCLRQTKLARVRTFLPRHQLWHRCIVFSHFIAHMRRLPRRLKLGD